jgi:hypothetical protein
LDLDTLLSPVTISVFLDQYYGRRFLHIPGSRDKFSGKPFAMLAQDLERELEAPVRVNQPGPSTGVAPHSRERDGIILQIDGDINCNIRDDAAEPALAWEGSLSQGDAVYIPRGWWIEASPGGTQVSFEIENPTGADLLAWIVKHVKRHEAFRPDIPRFADPATKADYMTSLRKTLVHFLRAPGMLEAYRRETNLIALPKNESAIPWNLDATEDHLISVLSPRKIRIKRADDETILLVAMGKRLAFPQEAAPLLYFLSDRAPVPVEEFYKAFEADFDRVELSDLLSALSKDGIIGLRKSGSI